MSDRRVLFFGDSFVAGLGDPTGLGWVGRVAAAAHDDGLPLTAYNLGVRRETSCDVAARWRAEARPRMTVAAASNGVVFSFGTNDTTEEDGRLRVEPGLAVDNLGRVLDEVAAMGCRAFVVGPPPAGDPAQDDRIAELSEQFARIAAGRGIPYVPVVEALRADDHWTAEAASGDGSHPGAQGYAVLAGLVLGGGWLDWLRSDPTISIRTN